MTTPDPTPEQLVTDALDVIALGYPIDGTFDEKAAWMADLQVLLEARAPIAREAAAVAVRAAMEDGDE